MIMIKPVDAQNVEIEAEGQSFGVFDSAGASEAMEALHAEYPGNLELSMTRWGFKATSPVIEKALELAGLSGLEAAKAQASGKAVF